MTTNLTIYEWMSLTYVSSLEACGIDLSHIHETAYLQFSKSSVVEWAYTNKPVIVCKDGFSMSVQGGFGKYSEPRYIVEMYKSMEIGFPSEKEELLDMDDDVKGYVDVKLIQQIIEKHGGFDVINSFKDCELKKVQLYLKKYIRERKLNRILDVLL